MKQAKMALCLAVAVLVTRSLSLGQTAESKQASITSVTGESWLVHLNRSFSETSMGKTGHLGPPAPRPGEEAARWLPASSISVRSQSVTLHGSDLYRLNCQGCHGELGQGAPPEINSVINPVRATSVRLVMERMKTTGMDISRTEAMKLAQQANAALLQRLHSGDQNMPPFPHLTEAEIRSLVVYLKQLAGVPGVASEQAAVQESPIRIGEHIVKSTCHTCHSATGADPEPQQIWDGAIPPLSALPSRKSQSDFIRKVTHGAPILMGTPPMLYRGRMPVFYYLSEQEAADVYLYLTTYPPAEPEDKSTPIVLSEQNATLFGDPPALSSASRSQLIASHEEQSPEAGSGYNMRTVALLVGVFLFVFLLLGGGLSFTIHEFKRLSAESERRKIARANPYLLSFPVRQWPLRSKIAREGNLGKIAR
jgi:mono/diheme cytochrome c family protein